MNGRTFHANPKTRGRTWICSARFCRSRCQTSSASTKAPTRHGHGRDFGRFAVSVPTTNDNPFALLRSVTTGNGREVEATGKSRGGRVCCDDAYGGATVSAHRLIPRGEERECHETRLRKRPNGYIKTRDTSRKTRKRLITSAPHFRGAFA